MPKFYVVSDVHGFYLEMRQALDEAGFDQNDENSWLISLGDNWDRGLYPAEVMRYLNGLDRCIMVRGNHESLYEELCERGYPLSHDFLNGTCATVCELGGVELGRSFDEGCMIAEHRTKLFLKKMVNYFETKNYIFVHSFIPLKCDDSLPIHYTKNRKFNFNPDWRNAHYSEWEQARWGNPYELAEQGLLPDKTLVFGHWHTSWPRHKYKGEPEFEEDANFSPYYGNGYIGIDACTAYSYKVNCLVIEDEFMEE